MINIENLLFLIKKNINKEWDGKKSILWLKERDYNWKQMEWIGFYFEKFSKDLALSNFNEAKEDFPKYGNTKFDLFLEYPIDFKSHANNSMSNDLIINDLTAIESSLKEFKESYLIIACGNVNYNDIDKSFQEWHEQLKGGLSNYSLRKREENAWSRVRKTKFILTDLYLIKVDKNLIKKSGGFFQEGMKNSNDNLRNRKLKINLDKIPNENIILNEHIDI